MINIEWPTLSLAILFNFIISAVISSWMTHRFVVSREARSKRSQERAIRQVLHEEIQYNKQVLREVITHVRDEEQKKKDSIEPDGMGGYGGDGGNPYRALYEHNLSRLSTDVWQSQMEKIPSVLFGDDLAKLFVFYRNLAEIQSRHDEYVMLWNQTVSDWRLQKILRLMEETVSKQLSVIK